MQEPRKVRVAAVQMAVGADVEKNLATCLRMIDEAARHEPDLVVLPEFCNHLSWYDDKAHCFRVSVQIGGSFTRALAAKAKEKKIHLVVNCTVQREGGVATGTSLLFGPRGDLIGASDKQVLMGHENDFLAPASSPAKIVETPFGRLGLYACMDGVIPETPRGLALRGAQILCNSLNSFAPDEASLHVPVRAAENRVFVVAANKVGPLIPEAMIEGVSAATKIPVRFLHGAGESQIVAPDGTVLAKGPRDEEAVVIADIVVPHADDKKRPDGTDVFVSRRPDLYRPISTAPVPREASSAAASIEVLAFAPGSEGAPAIDEAVQAVEEAGKEGARLVVLPELFFCEGGVVGTAPVESVIARSREVVASLARACGAAASEAPLHVVTTIAEEDGTGARHVGVVIGAGGIVHRQSQLHRSQRHAAWSTPGSTVGTIDLGWGRLGVVVGDDALYPETARLLAIEGAAVLAVSFQAKERWETSIGLVERAAENRVCVVAATRPSDVGTSLVATLWKDFTIMTPWETREFDGCITEPIVTRAGATSTGLKATVHPANAANKFVSHRTHLVEGRPWALAGAIAARGDHS